MYEMHLALFLKAGCDTGDLRQYSSQHVISTLYLDIAVGSDLHQLFVKPNCPTRQASILLYVIKRYVSR
jgi:hypothetical protein